MAAQYYKINYKSDFVLTINSDAGWAVPFCIKFWTGMPSHGYFSGFDGENYVNCRVGETPTQLLVMFDDHHMPIGPLRMQIAYHTTIEEFPDRKFDEVTNPTNVTVDIDGTEYQVMLDFTGETGAEIDFSMPSSGVMSVNGKIGYVTLNAEDVGAQPTIEDLDAIRSGAAEGATAYQKPGTGIPKTDLASGVQSSLNKADAAAPQANTYTKGEVNVLVEDAISHQTMIVTISSDGNYTADKTFAEIKSFIDNGGTVIAKDEEDGDSYYYLDNYIASEVVFHRNIWGSNGFTTRSYTIDNTNTVTFDDSLHFISSDVNSNSTANLANSAAVKTLNDKVATKQDTISDLSSIRNGAAAGATAVQPAGLTPIQTALQTIEAVIPSAATAQNQLADKNFVNSSISTNTANFVGTYNNLAELQAVQNPTNNDYGFVIETDAQGNEYYDRYKYVAASQQWLFEYKVESTPFTAAQWAAIQSGITSALVTKLNALPTNAELQQTLDGKANTSDIPTALSQLSQDSTHRTVTDSEKSTWNGKQNAIDDLATIRSGAAAGATAVQPAAMNTALATKQDTLTFDNTPTANSSNPVKSSGIKTALDAKQDTISDIATIRSNAAAGATAYQKPGTGIPPTDLASAVQTSLGKADTAIQSVTVGTTTTGAAGTNASVTNTGTATEPVLSFTIPQGAQGIQGIQGPQGERGPQGNTGVQVDSVASIIHSIDPTATYAAADVAGADAVQDVLSEVTELEGTVDSELYEKKADNTISSSTYTFTASKYISLSNGNVVSGSSSWNCTEDYIPIDNWLSVYTTATGGSSGAAVAFYKADKTYISGAPCGTTATIQVPTDAAYARFSKLAGSHTITTYILASKIDSINENIDAIEEDLETKYLKKPEEIDYLPNVVQGKAYKAGGIGTTIITNSNSAFYSAKIPCKKGDIFGIVTNGFGNAHPAIITDADDKVLWRSVIPNNITVGGVLEIAQDNAAYLYVSSYSSTITKLTKLAINSDDSIEVDSSYAKAGMLSITDACYSNSGYVGFAIPLLLKKGDVVKIKFKSYLNYRGYILKNASGTIVGSLSDTDLSAETLFCWNGEEDVYLYVNGLSSNPPHIIRYSRNVAKAMKNYGKKMVTLGDSITSYDSCDFGELVRGHLGVSYLKTSTQIDWGNIAEGNATICNWENTTDTCQHNSAIVDGTYVNRTLPNQVLQLLQHVTAEGEQITWHISSNNSDHSLATSVGVGTGYTTDIPDIIYIAMGTNDVVTTDDFSTVIAQSYSQLTKLTICSALRWSIETLQNKFPNAVIICVTPIVRTQRPTAEMEAKCELIKKMCAYMAIPVVDGYHISGFSPLSQGFYSSDNIHPTSYTQRIARSIAAQVDALC